MQINGISTNECPQSLTDGPMRQFISDFSEAIRFEGASMYGPDLSKWPADFFDAFSIFLYEDNRVENAKIDADSDFVTEN